MLKWELKNGRIVPNETSLLVSAFGDIWEFDSSRKKELACKLLTYVYFMEDITEENPLRDVAYGEKHIQAVRSLFKDDKHKFKKKEQELIDAAREWYALCNQDCLFRLSAVLSKKIDEFTQYMDENKATSAASFKAQVEIVPKINQILKTKSETDDWIRKEMKKVKVKGDRTRSPSEKGMVGYSGARREIDEDRGEENE